jgi:predicted ABC-type transport system involved in lysophospholipase L1 biosynthesis ATPase subunit
MNETNGAIVDVRHASRVYGSGQTAVAAIEDVSVTVHPGDLIGLVGPSGAGKSTLLALLGLLEAPTSGEVRVLGERADGLNEDRRADLRRLHIGFVFQLFHLIPALSALHNVAVPLLPYEPRKALIERARDLLAALGLGDREQNLPAQLSGGEQQRVAIARALIASPDLVLADEPTGNLDSRTSAQVMDLLLDLQAKHGFAMVMATHDERVAAQLRSRWELLDGVLRN